MFLYIQYIFLTENKYFLYLKFCNVPYQSKVKYIISTICSAQDNVKDMKNRAIVEQLNLLSKIQKYCCPFELNFYLLIGLNLELLV